MLVDHEYIILSYDKRENVLVTYTFIIEELPTFLKNRLAELSSLCQSCTMNTIESVMPAK